MCIACPRPKRTNKQEEKNESENYFESKTQTGQDDLHDVQEYIKGGNGCVLHGIHMVKEGGLSRRLVRQEQGFFESFLKAFIVSIRG